MSDAEQSASLSEELALLAAPVEGVPDVIADQTALAEAADAVRSGRGPIGLDAERASGYRYGQHAYLVQLRRNGTGTWLIDPVACPDLGVVDDAIGDSEWIVHAATQDLVCLAEVGLHPRVLFDTELGGRLAGRPRVGLGAMVEHYLGVRLAKEHSAADWSSRPLPEPWLRYAALDVEVLGDLRDAVADDLERQGKLGWAREEFDHLLSFTGPEPRVDPWRRTSGVHKVRSRRGLAIVRELWLDRDAIAQRRDVAPGRVLPDAAIAELATEHQRDSRAPRSVGSKEPRLARSIRRNEEVIVEGIAAALALSDDELPMLSLPNSGPPPARSWADRDPVAAARLGRSRELIAAVSQELAVPVENLLTPELLRRFLWEGPADPTTDDVSLALRAVGARPWQATLTAPLIARACAEHPVPHSG
ncbi:MAG: HRDC domain-containing protein [Intrasporangium sp.]|uniref:HRDC domain-containing protein n=1 Tax=Intrasporangium sp. TaxID=1925024 RepID=UPI00264979A4|nr:HRDC domain-containing protein [Intrasporangium sp.]MDN5794512.1 HRDC domain-containing protein [Intrasporangium sp.]